MTYPYRLQVRGRRGVCGEGYLQVVGVSVRALITVVNILKGTAVLVFIVREEEGGEIFHSSEFTRFSPSSSGNDTNAASAVWERGKGEPETGEILTNGPF